MAAHAADGGYRSKSFHRPVSGQRASPQDMASGFPRMGVGVGLRGVEGGGEGGMGGGRSYTFYDSEVTEHHVHHPFARRESLRPANSGELAIRSHFLQKGLSKT